MDQVFPSLIKEDKFDENCYKTGGKKRQKDKCRAFFKGEGTTVAAELRDTRDDGKVTLCTPHAATVLSRHCRADFGRPLTNFGVVKTHSRDGPGVTAPLQTITVPLTKVWNSPFRYPPLKSPRALSNFVAICAPTGD